MSPLLRSTARTSCLSNWPFGPRNAGMPEMAWRTAWSGATMRELPQLLLQQRSGRSAAAAPAWPRALRISGVGSCPGGRSAGHLGDLRADTPPGAAGPRWSAPPTLATQVVVPTRRITSPTPHETKANTMIRKKPRTAPGVEVAAEGRDHQTIPFERRRGSIVRAGGQALPAFGLWATSGAEAAEDAEGDAMRQLIAGNWKMNGLRADAIALAQGGGAHGAQGLACDLLVCPPFTVRSRRSRDPGGLACRGRRPGLPHRSSRARIPATSPPPCCAMPAPPG